MINKSWLFLFPFQAWLLFMWINPFQAVVSAEERAENSNKEFKGKVKKIKSERGKE